MAMTGTVVVTVNLGCGQNVRLDQLVERHQHVGGSIEPFGLGREAERQAFEREPLGLPVERLVLSLLLEQEHGEVAGAYPQGTN